MATHGRGLICMPMTEERLDELDLPQMVAQNTAQFDTAFCVTIEAQGRDEHRHLGRRSRGDGAGGDRSAAPGRRIWRGPGTCSRCKARNGGVLVRAGQTEAAVDLARIAGLYPAGVICEIMNEDGTMARVPELTRFAKRHKLLMITIADLIQYRMRTEALVQPRRVGGAADRARRVPRHRLREPASTARRTSRWSRGTSATARTCWCACTRGA